MNLFGNIALGFAAFVYLIPLQITLRQPMPPGHAGPGTAFALVVFMGLLWVSLLATWCVLVAQGGFAWMGGGRMWQFSAMLAGWLALVAVITLSVFLRGDSDLPVTLRPLMPWGIYVLPLFALLATLCLLNPTLEVPVSVSRWTLSFCGAVALMSSFGMGTQWIVWQETRAVDAARAQVDFEDQNVRSLVAEVEALDPIKDLGRLLGHAASNRFEAPRDLAVKKIQTHPNLQAELAVKLTNAWKLEALGYLELNAPPDAAGLAIPVRTALEGMALWIKGEVERSAHHWPEAFYGDTQMALAVAAMYAPYGIDYVPAIRAWRAAFDHPHAKQANIRAPQLIDAWLAKKTPADKSHASASTRR